MTTDPETTARALLTTALHDVPRPASEPCNHEDGYGGTGWVQCEQDARVIAATTSGAELLRRADRPEAHEHTWTPYNKVTGKQGEPDRWVCRPCGTVTADRPEAHEHTWTPYNKVTGKQGEPDRWVCRPCGTVTADRPEAHVAEGLCVYPRCAQDVRMEQREQVHGGHHGQWCDDTYCHPFLPASRSPEPDMPPGVQMLLDMVGTDEPRRTNALNLINALRRPPEPVLCPVCHEPVKEAGEHADGSDPTGHRARPPEPDRTAALRRAAHDALCSDGGTWEQHEAVTDGYVCRGEWVARLAAKTEPDRTAALVADARDALMNEVVAHEGIGWVSDTVAKGTAAMLHAFMAASATPEPAPVVRHGDEHDDPDGYCAICESLHIGPYTEPAPVADGTVVSPGHFGCDAERAIAESRSLLVTPAPRPPEPMGPHKCWCQHGYAADSEGVPPMVSPAPRPPEPDRTAALVEKARRWKAKGMFTESEWAAVMAVFYVEDARLLKPEEAARIEAIVARYEAATPEPECICAVTGPAGGGHPNIDCPYHVPEPSPVADGTVEHEWEPVNLSRDCSCGWLADPSVRGSLKAQWRAHVIPVPRSPEPECKCEGEFVWACGPECSCWHHARPPEPDRTAVLVALVERWGRETRGLRGMDGPRNIALADGMSICAADVRRLLATPEPAPVVRHGDEHDDPGGYCAICESLHIGPYTEPAPVAGGSIPPLCRCGGSGWTMECPVHDLPTPVADGTVEG